MSSTEETSPTTLWVSSSTTMHPMIKDRGSNYYTNVV
jgi:hypothetical protein